MSSSDPDDAPDGGEDSPLFRRSGGGVLRRHRWRRPRLAVAYQGGKQRVLLPLRARRPRRHRLAVTYQPPDPWLQSSAAITTSLSRVLPNSTFLVPDDSLLPTGEDFNSSTAVPAPVRDEDDAAAAVSAASAAAAGNRTCDPDLRPGFAAGGVLRAGASRRAACVW
jgi:hypothetical protein